MNSPVSPTDLPAHQPAKSTKRPFVIGLLIVVGLFLIGALLSGGGGSLGLEVTRQDFLFRSDGLQLEIMNVGSGPIRVDQITINGRSDCTTIPVAGEAMKFSPTVLKVGDTTRIYGSCKIVRAAIRTEQGSAEYSFQ